MNIKMTAAVDQLFADLWVAYVPHETPEDEGILIRESEDSDSYRVELPGGREQEFEFLKEAMELAKTVAEQAPAKRSSAKQRPAKKRPAKKTVAKKPVAKKAAASK